MQNVVCNCFNNITSITNVFKNIRRFHEKSKISYLILTFCATDKIIYGKLFQKLKKKQMFGLSLINYLPTNV